MNEQSQLGWHQTSAKKCTKYNYKTRILHASFIHSKNPELFQPNLGSNMDKPKCWVKNAIQKCTVESESWSWVKILNDILTQHLGLSIFYPNLGSNNPALFRVYYSEVTCYKKRQFTWIQMNQFIRTDQIFQRKITIY